MCACVFWGLPYTARGVLRSPSSRTERGHVTYLRNSPWTSPLHKHSPVEHIPLSHSPSLSHMHARTPPSRSARRFANFHKMVYNSNNIHHANPAWSRNATWKLTQTAYIADILLRPRVFSVVASPNRWSSLRLDSKKKRKKEPRQRATHASVAYAMMCLCVSCWWRFFFFSLYFPCHESKTSDLQKNPKLPL